MIGADSISAQAIAAPSAGGAAQPAASRAVAPLALTAAAQFSGRADAPLALVQAESFSGRAGAPLRLSQSPRAGRAVAGLSLRASVGDRARAALHLVLLPDGLQTPGELAWGLVVRLGGADISSRITGEVVIEASEGSARLADVAYRPAPGALDLPALIGARVEIDAVLGSAPPLRRFTGVVDSPEFDPDTGLVTLRCTDNLQARLDALDNAEIDALLGNACDSPAVFDDARTGWARAQDLVSTMCASLDADAYGALRVTPWAVGAPARTLTPAHYLDGSLRTRFAEFTRLPPRVEIDISYRFPRLKTRAVELAWQYGWSEGYANINGLRRLSSEMVREALESSGWEIATLRFDRYPHGWRRPPGGEANAYQWYDPALCRGFSGLARRRYVQQIEERYRLVVTNPYPPAAALPGALRESLALAVEADTEAWERGPVQRTDATSVLDYLPAPAPALAFAAPVPIIPGESALDLTEGESDGRTALAAAGRALVARAARQIQAALRASAVEVDIPFDPLVDLPQVLTVQTPTVQATGKVRRFRERFDHDAGTAITQVELAVSPMATAAAGDLAWPAAPDSTQPLSPEELSSRCGNYLGSVSGAAELDEAMVGFFTNAQPSSHPDAVFDSEAPAYPEHFTVELPEIAERHRALMVSAAPALEISAGCPGGTMTLEVL